MAKILIAGHSPDIVGAIQADRALGAHEIHQCPSHIHAVRYLRKHPSDVVLTDPDRSIREHLAVAKELWSCCPGIRIVVLCQEATKEEVIDALRSHVFACFTAPFDVPEIAEMVRAALQVTDWRDGIEVVSGLPHWLTLRVACRLVSADRLVAYMSELQTALPDGEGELLLAAFRELLLNAMEHGAGFDPDKVIEVTATKTARAIVYHFRDPGLGFKPEDVKHAATSLTPDEVIQSALHRAERGMRPGGFGMLIARQVADELVYNERHNEVLLIKYLA